MTKKEGTKRNSADSASAEPCDVMLNRSNRQGFGSGVCVSKKCYVQILQYLGTYRTTNYYDFKLFNILLTSVTTVETGG
jgi:hypothetical protein